jgi:hypothetical protein
MSPKCVQRKSRVVQQPLVPGDSKPNGSAPSANAAETSVDKAVERTIKNHFSGYTGSELQNLRLGDVSLFAYCKTAFVEHRARGAKLSTAWWTQVHKAVEGLGHGPT